MNNITSLKENELFVFGSNLAGKHIGGAARQAKEMFGAIDGCGEGLTGKSYAFPTLTENFEKVTHEQLIDSVSRLYRCCEENKDKVFLLTKVGCGIAGFEEEYIKYLFLNSPKNLILPDDWNY